MTFILFLVLFISHFHHTDDRQVQVDFAAVSGEGVVLNQYGLDASVRGDYDLIPATTSSAVRLSLKNGATLLINDNQHLFNGCFQKLRRCANGK